MIFFSKVVDETCRFTFLIKYTSREVTKLIKNIHQPTSAGYNKHYYAFVEVTRRLTQTSCSQHEENPEVGLNIEKRCRFEKVLQFIFSHKNPQQNR